MVSFRGGSHHHEGRPRLRAAAFGAAALLLAGGATTVAVAAGNDTSQPEEGPVPVSAPDVAQVSSFGILRRARTAADETAPAHGMTFSSASGANQALARSPLGLQGARAWVIPGRGLVCLLAESSDGVNGGAACVPDEAASAGYLEQQASSASAPGVVLLSGLVPDGVSSVRIELADGTSVGLPVRENVYATQVTGQIAGISFTGPHGPVTLASAIEPPS